MNTVGNTWAVDRASASRITKSLIVVGLLTAATWCDNSMARARDLLVIAEADNGQPIALPSVAANFDSFEAVSNALTEDRQRVTALEERLRQLEHKSSAE